MHEKPPDPPAAANAPPPPDREGHVPVMLDTVLAMLEPGPGQTVLDCTAGRGGHGAAIIPKLSPGGCYVAIDLDPVNVEHVRQRLAPLAGEAGVTLHVVQGDFQNARAILDALNLSRVQGLLADLGVASTHLDRPERGFSFGADGPLDMRLDATSAGPTAGDLVNELDEFDLADVIYRFGEERLSRRIARKIVERRRQHPIQSTRELADLVRSAYGGKAARQKIHPATRTFQALRIAVNGELLALDRLLASLPELMSAGGRVVLISFHSLEDRPVKQAFVRYDQAQQARRLNRKVIQADENEVAANPRSRSAKLRALQWLTE